jgi:hypothetical protein
MKLGLNGDDLGASTLRSGKAAAPDTEPGVKTTFKLYRNGREDPDMIIGIEAEDVMAAKARFEALWAVCASDADCAALFDEKGKLIWGAERTANGVAQRPRAGEPANDAAAATSSAATAMPA